MSKYILSIEAELDLNDIWDFIAEDSLDAADRWIDMLFEAFGILAESPGIGHRRKDLTAAPILFWPVGAYMVIYRERPERIEIIAVTQGSRDIPSFLYRRGTD